MKGDYTRFTFDPAKRYSAVLMQQGRVQLDADWNENEEIEEYHDRTETVDVIGRAGAPEDGGGFAVEVIPGVTGDLLLTRGRIWVGGLLCELGGGSLPVIGVNAARDRLDVPTVVLDDRPFADDDWVEAFAESGAPTAEIRQVASVDAANGRVQLTAALGAALADADDLRVRGVLTYATQSELPEAPEYQPGDGRTDLVYLDVWQRHVTAVEDPDIREVALGGPDTATRLQTVCQVRIEEGVSGCDAVDDLAQAQSRGRLSTRAVPGPPDEDLCRITPGGGYRGLENRLYRVEIVKGGDIGAAKFVWSRENGSVVFAVEEFPAGQLDRIVLRNLGPDEPLGLGRLDWVEILDDEDELAGRTGTIAQVIDIDEAKREALLDQTIPTGKYRVERRARVRRWDREEASGLAVATTDDDPVELEAGVEIEFSGEDFQPGDHWLFAARTSTADVERLYAAPPRRAEHHFCPLATLAWTDDEGGLHPEVEDCRPPFVSLTDLLSQRVLRYVSGDGQEGLPGEVLPESLVVGVEDGLGRPVEDYEVMFTPSVGSVDAPAPPFLTDANGLASCSWRLGGDPDASHKLVAELASTPSSQNASLPVIFYATPLYRALRYVGGDGQEGSAGQTLPGRIAVGVEDGLGRLLSGVDVTFDVTVGGGQVRRPPDAFGDPVTVKTNAAGIASCEWKLGSPDDAENEVTATLVPGQQDDALPIVFRARSWERQLLLRGVGGDGQEGRPGDLLSCPILVGVEDEHGRPVAGAAVILRAQFDDDRLADLADEENAGAHIEVKTDGDGRAGAWWTLGGEPSCHRVVARLADPPQENALEVFFEASVDDLGGGHAPYLVLRHVGGDGQEGRPGERLSCPLFVGVEDEQGQPRADVSLTFSAAGGDVLTDIADLANQGAQIHVVTDAEGIASVRWTLAAGARRCRRVVASLDDPPQEAALTVQFEANAGPWARIVQTSWQNDVSLALNALNEGLIVRFSEPMRAETVTRETFVVSLEIPDQDRFTDAPGHRPLIVQGRVQSAANTAEWRFRPEPQIEPGWLDAWINAEEELFHNNRILARVVLKGHAILDAKDRLPIDGSAAGVAEQIGEEAVTVLRLPSGNGTEGSDFQSWFWLEG